MMVLRYILYNYFSIFHLDLYIINFDIYNFGSLKMNEENNIYIDDDDDIVGTSPINLPDPSLFSDL